MKSLLILLCAIVATAAQAQSAGSLNWQNNPNNFRNSELNYQNSSLNYTNSPLNYENSQLNYGQRGGVYNNDGDQIGYRTRNPNGVTNYFDNDGDRMGFSSDD